MVIVDDGSTDATYSLMKKKQEEYADAQIYLVRHLINRGGGAANKTLFQFATLRDKYLGVERWVTFDADGQMSVEDLEKFLPYIHDEYDILL